MIGVDIARIKRWYAKTYPSYAGTAYKIVVTVLTQTAIDTTHNLDGVDLTFTCVAYKLSDNSVVNSVSGVYNRKHYGGWDAYVPVVPNGSGTATLSDSENGEPGGSETVEPGGSETVESGGGEEE